MNALNYWQSVTIWFPTRLLTHCRGAALVTGACTWNEGEGALLIAEPGHDSLPEGSLQNITH